MTAKSMGVNKKDMGRVLKEKMTKKTIISIVLILIGIVWFYQ